MQLSSLYRRGAVVPLSHDAAERLAIEDVEPSTPVQLIKIATQGDFEDLWSSGLFSAINQRIGSLLDDYETECIDSASVPVLKEVLISFSGKFKEGTAKSEFLVGVIELCDVALREQAPIYFVL